MFFFLSRAGSVFFLKRTNCDHERDFGRGGGTRLTGDGVVSDAVVKVEAASSVRSVGHADNVGRNWETIVSQRAGTSRFLSAGSGQAETAADPRAVRSAGRWRRRPGCCCGCFRVARWLGPCYLVQIRTVLTRYVAAVVAAGQVGRNVMTTRLRRVDRRRWCRFELMASEVRRPRSHFGVGILMGSGHLVLLLGRAATFATVVWSVGLGRRQRIGSDGTRRRRRRPAASVIATRRQFDQPDAGRHQSGRIFQSVSGAFRLFELDHGADGRQNVRVAVGALADVRRDRVARPQDADESDGALRDDAVKHFGYTFDAGLVDAEADGDDRARWARLVRFG